MSFAGTIIGFLLIAFIVVHLTLYLLESMQDGNLWRITRAMNTWVDKHFAADSIERITAIIIWTCIIGFFIYATSVSLSN